MMKNVLVQGDLILKALQEDSSSNFDVLWEILKSPQVQGYIEADDLAALYQRLVCEQTVEMAFSLASQVQHVLQVYSQDDVPQLDVAIAEVLEQSSQQAQTLPTLSIDGFLERYALNQLYEIEQVGTWYRQWRDSKFDPLFLLPIVLSITLQTIPFFQKLWAQNPGENEESGLEFEIVQSTSDPLMPSDGHTLPPASEARSPDPYHNDTSSQPNPEMEVIEAPATPQILDPSFGSAETLLTQTNSPTRSPVVRATPRAIAPSNLPQINFSSSSSQSASVQRHEPNVIGTHTNRQSSTEILAIAPSRSTPSPQPPHETSENLVVLEIASEQDRLFGGRDENWLGATQYTSEGELAETFIASNPMSFYNGSESDASHTTQAADAIAGDGAFAADNDGDEASTDSERPECACECEDVSTIAGNSHAENDCIHSTENSSQSSEIMDIEDCCSLCEDELPPCDSGETNPTTPMPECEGDRPEENRCLSRAADLQGQHATKLDDLLGQMIGQVTVGTLEALDEQLNDKRSILISLSVQHDSNLLSKEHTASIVAIANSVHRPMECIAAYLDNLYAPDSDLQDCPYVLNLNP